MSCGRTENDDEENPALPPTLAAVSKCERCDKPPTILIRATGYCQDCFFMAFRSKVKKGIEGAKRRSFRGSQIDIDAGITRGNKRSSALIAFSGGAGSRVVMDLMKPFLERVVSISAKYQPIAPFEKIEVLYIDESGVPGYGGIDRTEEIREIVESAGFDFLPLKLEDIFATSAGSPFTINSASTNLTSQSTSTSLPTPLESLLSLLSPHSSTSRSSLHSSLLNSLIRQTALSRSHDIILTGETATRIAIKVLAGMAEGRGFSMGEEIGSEWESEDKLCHFRPLNICLGKEISFYNRVKGLKSLVMINPKTGVEPRIAGIDSLTEAFVSGLESAFPSTVSTIIRTAGKLGMRSSNDQIQKIKSTPCPLCGLPAQPGANEWRSSITISTFDKPTCTSLPSSTPIPTTTSSNLSSNTSITPIPLASLLCYGCLLLYQGVQQSSITTNKSIEEKENSIELLPFYVGQAANLRWEREKIDITNIGEEEDDIIESVRIKSQEEVRKEIEEFLID